MDSQVWQTIFEYINFCLGATVDWRNFRASTDFLWTIQKVKWNFASASYSLNFKEKIESNIIYSKLTMKAVYISHTCRHAHTHIHTCSLSHSHLLDVSYIFMVIDYDLQRSGTQFLKPLPDLLQLSTEHFLYN